MAAIMLYAMKNPFCAKIFSTSKYSTTTNVHTNGRSWYNGVLVDQIERNSLTFKTVSVTAGKTGWTGKDSGACIVSFATAENGHKYILVTANAYCTNYDPKKHTTYSASMEWARNDMKYLYDTYAK